MGQNQILTKKQQIILDQIAKNSYLTSSFYFTGGTALSEVYLKHRYSDDIDIFSETKFDNQIILSFMENLGKKIGFTINSKFVQVVYIFNLTFKDGETLKVDFSYYPYKRVEEGTVLNGIQVDSLLDIATNKLMSVTQRTQVKDFVDLYFLLEHFTIWDLMQAVNVKFRQKLDPFIVASDFSKAEDFEFMPVMIKPLSLATLKKFYLKEAKRLGGSSLE